MNFTPLDPESPIFQGGDEYNIKFNQERKPRPKYRGLTGFTCYIEEKRKKIDQTLRKLLSQENKNNPLIKAIHYSIFPGGKRFRPILCISTHEMFLPEDENILTIASSIELFHTFTLIHDDLPCMDNDDYRRGKPTCHKVFGEAVALLTGDALFNLGYETLINAKIPDRVKVRIIQEISSSLGIKGVVGGQVEDIDKKKAKKDISLLKEIYLKKTASLIIASLKIGGIVANTNDEKLSALSNYGENLGLAFQIMDDVIEAKEGGEKEDNFATILGVEKAEELAKEAIMKAKNSLNVFEGNSSILKTLANWCIERKN